MAKSRAYGKLVAPRMRIPSSSLPTPCILVKNYVLTLFVASLSFSDRLLHKASISSMKIMEGFFSLARVKREFIIFSLYPTYLLRIFEGSIAKKVLSASVAQAFARKVFPVPGGPYKRIPFQGYLGPLNIFLNLTGMRIASLRAAFAP